MSPSKSKEIVSIENHILRGNFIEAINLTEKILENKDSSKQDRFHAHFLRGKTLNELAFFENKRELYNEALNYLKEAVQESGELDNISLKLEANYWLAYVQLDLFRYEDVLKTNDKMVQIFETTKSKDPTELKHANAIMYSMKSLKLEAEIKSRRDVPKNSKEIGIQNIKKSLKIYKELDYEFYIAHMYFILGNWYSYKSDYQQAIKEYEKSLKIAEKWGNKNWCSNTLREIAGAYWLKGDIEKIPEYISKAIELNEEIGNEYALGLCQNMLGIYYAEKGDCDQALKYFIKAKELWERTNQKNMLCTAYNNIGVVYSTKGDIDKALDHYLKAQKIWEELDLPGISIHIGNIAFMYYLKGELDKAYKLLVKQLDACEKFDIKGGIANTSHQLSLVLWQQGKTKEALKAMERSLKLREELENKIYLGLALGDMITLLIETNQFEPAKQHLEQFKVIVDEIDNKPLLLKYRLSEALVLKISEQHRDRIKAEVLFEQLLEEELEYRIHVEVLLNLSELLLNELQNTDDETILEKIKKHVNRLYEFAVSNNSHLLTVEALWLQSQIAMIELDVKKAQEILQKAQNIIEEKGLERLVSKIADEREKLEKLSSDLIEAGKKAYSISKRMELVNVQNTVKEIRKNRLVEDTLEDISPSKKLFSIKI